MDRELDDRLCKSYSLIFKDRHGDMRNTAMCWGFEIGNGWYSLIDNLCDSLMSPVRDASNKVESMLRIRSKCEPWHEKFLKEYADSYNDEALAKAQKTLEEKKAQVPVASQVKQKFGRLRFYTWGATPIDQAKISLAEAMSGSICETCGRFDDAVICYDRAGWVITACPEHAKQFYRPDWVDAYIAAYMPYKKGEYDADTFVTKLGEWEDLHKATEYKT